MNDKYFFKNYQLKAACKNCRAMIIFNYKSWKARLGLCIMCRRKYIRKREKDYYNTPRGKEVSYEKWKRWVKKDVKNFIRRRQLALESYHRRKNDPNNKARKHRATKIPV